MPTLLLFCLFSAGISWNGEFMALGVLNAYVYKTGVLQDLWAQNLLGHMLLNASLYPAVALASGVYRLKYYKIAIICALLVAIEFLFVRLKIYEQHWWKYYMTFVGAFVYLTIARYWFPMMLQKRYGWTRFLTFYLAAMVLLHFPTPVLTLLGKEYFRLSWVNHLCGNMYLSSIVIIFTYHLLIGSTVLVVFGCMLKKWYWKIVPFLVSGAALTIFYLTGVLVLQNGWRLPYSILVDFVFIALFILLARTALREETRPPAAP